MRKPLFHPHEYQELSEEERNLLSLAYEKALEALRKCITPRGFTSCSLADNAVYGTDANYRSVWARDGAMTILSTLDLEDPEIRQCQRQTLVTLLKHQSAAGQIPAHVLIDSDRPEYGGVGGIASIDSVLWLVIAMYRYAEITEDWSLVHEHRQGLQKAMDWLEAHDSNGCGLLEIPEASDWADLFGWSFHVLYDEVLWQRCLFCYAATLEQLGDQQRAARYAGMAQNVQRILLTNFWPTTVAEDKGQVHPQSFTQTQFALGDARYLVAQITPFGFSWRCDVYANILAYLTNLIDQRRAMMTFRFLWGVGVNEPWPVKNLYPPVHSGDPEWREYYTVNLLNLPDHYHNGGIWPFIGGMWVRYIYKLGMTALARRELVKLARLNAMGSQREWEFNEWHHGVTGRPMGKAYQAWSAASFLRACHDLHVEVEQLRP
jgi:glycogen debranching enzyme